MRFRSVGLEPGNLFLVEVAAGLAAPRSLALRAGVLLLLGLPFALVRMPAEPRLAGLTLLVVFTGLFGATVARVRRRTEGVEERLRLLPVPRWRAAVDRILAGAALDVVQVVPVFALFFGVHAGVRGGGDLFAVAGLLAGTLVALNALGYLLAGLVGSNAEAHLAGALGVAGVAVLSGLVPVPGRLGGMVAATARWSPPAYLLEILRELTGEGVESGRVAGSVVLAACAAAFIARGVAGLPGRTGKGGPP